MTRMTQELIFITLQKQKRYDNNGTDCHIGLGEERRILTLSYIHSGVSLSNSSSLKKYEMSSKILL